ncbi:MAG: SBBP repeat-containing protein, partial [Bacteroidota bacterium]
MRTWFTGGDLLIVLDGGRGTGHVLRQRFLGSGDDALTALAPLDARWSFIRPGGTIAGVRGYGELQRDAIYPGIGARYYRRGESLKYDLLVAPGADPRLIHFRYDGADRTVIGDDGALHVGTSVGELLEAPPYCYQDIGGTRRSIPCRFVRDRGGIGFSVGRYDRSRPLVIDPSLVYSSYFGGRLADAGRGVTLDTSGNIVVTGITISPDIPTTVGAYGRALNPSGAQDIFVAKLDPTGSRLIYATYIGGGGDDEPASVRILPNGRVVVAGSTASPDFPVTPNQRGYRGKGDGFVLILDDFGTGLALSTCVGGGEDDHIEGLAIGSGGDIYVAGRTRSADFPTSANYPTTKPSYNTTLRGAEDAFVARLTQAGVFYYSTYLGGDSNDVATAIAVEPGGAAWVTGWTYSDNFPMAGTPFSSVLRGKSDCFVTRFRFDGTTPEYSTLIGGDGDDLARSIALDADGSAYITGSTTSSDYPFSIPNPVASASWFVTKFLFVRGPRTTTRDYSRRIGAQDNGSGWTIQAGANNEVFIAGSTDAADFPL